MSQPPYPSHFYSGYGGPFHGSHSRFFAYRRGIRFGFFPRIFWFALGAGATVWWTRRNERIANGDHDGSWGCSRRRLPRAQQQPVSYDARSEELNSTPVEARQQYNVRLESHRSHDAQGRDVPAPILESHHDIHTAERIKEVGRQAGDAMVEISESALDSLLSNIQILKAKLKENREQREKLYLEQRIPVESQTTKNDAQSRRINMSLRDDEPRGRM